MSRFPGAWALWEERAATMGIVVPLTPPRPNAAGTAPGGTDAPTPGPSDGELVERARGGDEGALETLYRRHAGMVIGLAHRLLGGRDDVDDVVQDVFLTAFEKLASLRDPQAFAGWVGGITVRKARRRLGRRPASAVEADSLVAWNAPPDTGAELRNLYAILHTLPADVRIALVLRRVEGMTLPAIAEAMGKSLATVKRRLSDGETLLSAHTRSP